MPPWTGNLSLLLTPHFRFPRRMGQKIKGRHAVWNAYCSVISPKETPRKASSQWAFFDYKLMTNKVELPLQNTVKGQQHGLVERGVYCQAWDLGLIPRTQMIEEKNQLLLVVLWPCIPTLSQKWLWFLNFKIKYIWIKLTASIHLCILFESRQLWLCGRQCSWAIYKDSFLTGQNLQLQWKSLKKMNQKMKFKKLTLQ